VLFRSAIFGAICVALIVLALAAKVRGDISKGEKSILPDDKLTLRTFIEMFIEYFYNLMKDMMGAHRAKQYFPLIGAAALFIFVSNFLGLVPGFAPPTSSWSITLGMAAIVFVWFNFHGIRENGWAYLKHLAGPAWWLAWLIFPLEVFSLFLRPFTLSFRLMINMSVDHMLLGVVTALVWALLPMPVMMLGTIVAIVQVLVFCLLSSIYITLATEHEHDDAHAHAH